MLRKNTLIRFTGMKPTRRPSPGKNQARPKPTVHARLICTHGCEALVRVARMPSTRPHFARTKWFPYHFARSTNAGVGQSMRQCTWRDLRQFMHVYAQFTSIFGWFGTVWTPFFTRIEPLVSYRSAFR